jgi:hypothetical protein
LSESAMRPRSLAAIKSTVSAAMRLCGGDANLRHVSPALRELPAANSATTSAMSGTARRIRLDRIRQSLAPPALIAAMSGVEIRPWTEPARSPTPLARRPTHSSRASAQLVRLQNRRMHSVQSRAVAAVAIPDRQKREVRSTDERNRHGQQASVCC